VFFFFQNTLYTDYIYMLATADTRGGDEVGECDGCK